MGMFDTFKALVNLEITSKTTPSSIDPADVGARFGELCDLIEPVITDIISITASTAAPSGGNDGDVHIVSGTNPAIVWQKISGSWTPTGELEFFSGSEVSTETVPLTSVDLNSSFPNVSIGYEVICKDCTDGPRIYKKVSDTEWMIIMLQFI